MLFSDRRCPFAFKSRNVIKNFWENHWVAQVTRILFLSMKIDCHFYEDSALDWRVLTFPRPVCHTPAWSANHACCVIKVGATQFRSLHCIDCSPISIRMTLSDRSGFNYGTAKWQLQIVSHLLDGFYAERVLLQKRKIIFIAFNLTNQF